MPNDDAPRHATREAAFEAMWQALIPGFVELLATGWDPSPEKAKALIEEKLGPARPGRKKAA